MISLEQCRERALSAQEKLKESEERNNRKVCTIIAAHINPEDGNNCHGNLLINFGSWENALKNSAMTYFGSIGAVCLICGFDGRLNKEKQWVD